MQDIFLSYNMFFILDCHQQPTLIRNDNTVYVIKDVIDVNASIVSLQDDAESSESSEEERRQSISNRMFD